MKNKNHIDRSTLIRYLKGELPSEEAWKVEKAMQDDPFLAEAMEGLELAMRQGDPEEDFEELERRIQARATRSKPMPVAFLIRMAAVLLILTVSTFAILEWFRHDSGNGDEIAMKKTPGKQDTSGAVMSNRSGNPQITEEIVPVSPETGEAVEGKGLTTPAKPSGRALKPAQETQADIDKDNEAEYAYSATEKENGQVTGERSGAGPVTIDSAQITETEDLAGITKKQAPVVRMDAARDESAAEEYKQESVSPVSQAKAAREVTAGDVSSLSAFIQATPVNGDSSYMEYIRSRLIYPQEAKDSGIQGDVILQFTVEPDSTLHDIRVVKGIGSGCDEEAIRLVKHGPAWAPAVSGGKPVSSKVIYTINFQLKK